MYLVFHGVRPHIYMISMNFDVRIIDLSFHLNFYICFILIFFKENLLAVFVGETIRYQTSSCRVVCWNKICSRLSRSNKSNALIVNYRTTVCFDYSSLVYGLYAFYGFEYLGRLVTSQQIRHFILSPLQFYLPFGFVSIRKRSWNLEIPGFRAVRKDHKGVKKIET